MNHIAAISPSSTRTNQARKSIRSKLFDPCTICRYETIYYSQNDDNTETAETAETAEKAEKDEISTNNSNNIARRNSNAASIPNSQSYSDGIRLNQNDAMKLSFVPWQIKIKKETAMMTIDKQSCKDNNKSSRSFPSSFISVCYPPWNYLTIRHEQNYNWAQSQLEKGVEYAKTALQQQQQQQQTVSSTSLSSSLLLEKAESCYKQGLGLIPSHIGLLTAYSALCINDNRLLKAKQMLIGAIEHGESTLSKFKIRNNSIQKESEVQNVIKDAKLYLHVVEKKLKHEKEAERKSQSLFIVQNSQTNPSARVQQLALSSKAEMAFNDALAERSMIASSSQNEDMEMNDERDKKQMKKNVKSYELLYSSSSDDHKNHSGYKKDDDSASSSNSSYDSGEARRKRKRHKRKKKKRRAKKYESSDSSRKKKRKRRKDV